MTAIKPLLSVILTVIGIGVFLLLIATVKTLFTKSGKSTYVADEDEEESLRLAKKLSRMIQYDTTSYDGSQEREKFLGFHQVLEELFPLVHKHLERKIRRKANSSHESSGCRSGRRRLGA